MYKKTTNKETVSLSVEEPEILSILHQDLPKLRPVAETIKRDIESGKHDDLLADNFK